MGLDTPFSFFSDGHYNGDDGGGCSADAGAISKHVSRRPLSNKERQGSVQRKEELDYERDENARNKAGSGKPFRVFIGFFLSMHS